jgi:hypothetical protein
MDFFLHKDALHKIKPLEWAKEKILKFKERWYKVYVVTWRWDNLKEHTIAWLDLNYHNIFDDVYFTNSDMPNFIPKSKFCKDLWAEFMVEDNLEFARDVASKWIKVYLLDKPWNQKYDKTIDKWIIKIKDWSEIVI